MQQARGFTLIELMVAIAVMALLAIASWRGLDGMVRAQEQTRAHADASLVLQTVLAQWTADLDAMQAIEHTEAIAWDGQVLRITRRSTRQLDEGVIVAAWARRADGGMAGGGQWLRWQSPPLRTRAEWQEAWQRAAQWARAPGDAERRMETALLPLAGWQVFYHRGGAWVNAQSSSDSNGDIGGGSAPQMPSSPPGSAASMPDGVRLELSLPVGGTLTGTVTRDWANPLLGGRQIMKVRCSVRTCLRRMAALPPRARNAKRSAWRRSRASGAALLSAMLTVTLVATFAAAAMWQQWRAVEVETAERARIQSAWILSGALDWSRLILREDALARDGDGTDNLTEPWSVPLAEARLSTFLAARRNVVQVEDASTDTADAFLSGTITDQQGLLNLRNLVKDGQVDTAARRQFERLFQYLGLPVQQVDALAQHMLRADAQGADAASAPLLPLRTEQLGWWGLPPQTVQAIAPYITLLPAPTPVNLNTAGAVVLWASADGLDMAQAQRLVQAREARHFRDVSDAAELVNLPGAITTATHTTASSYFEARGQLRLDTAVVEERSLLYRQRSAVQVLWRVRGATLQTHTVASSP